MTHVYWIPIAQYSTSAALATHQPAVYDDICEVRDQHGNRCPWRKSFLYVNRQYYGMRFCQYHQCPAVEQNGVCGVAKKSDQLVCNIHSTCKTTNQDGSRCQNPVKNRDPSRFEFCADRHSCINPICTSLRAMRNSTMQTYCAAHLCTHESCTSPRTGASSHCSAHHCSHPDCLTYIPSPPTDPASPLHFCRHHRICSHASCDHTINFRDDGTNSRFCRLHHCARTGCDNEVGLGSHCLAHTCQVQNCPAEIVAVGGRWCAGHECEMERCRERRDEGWGNWCVRHRCRKAGCTAVTAGDGYCEGHARCVTVGCERQKMEGQTRCDHHHVAHCTWGTCRTDSVPHSEFCQFHVCSYPNCPNLSVLAHGGFCSAHKCTDPACYAPRQPLPAPIDQTASLLYLLPQQGHAAGLGLWCAGHTCTYQGCPMQGAEGGRCEVHAGCQKEGCMAAKWKGEGADGKYCTGHLKGREDGWGRWANEHAG